MISPTVEDYLKAVYKLQIGKEKVTTSAIAERLNLSNASVTSMIKKLSRQKFVKHISYRGVVLTEKGEKEAINVIRRHRLVELFLKEILKLDWDKVHDEAERLEHYISNEILDTIDRILDYPNTDPHGDPIPNKNGDFGSFPQNNSLDDVNVGETVIISCVSDREPKKLQFMLKLGLLPGVSITIRNRTPFDGDMDIKVGKSECHLPVAVAKSIFVTQGDEKLKGENIKH